MFNFLFSNAYAQDAATGAPAQGGFMSFFPLIAIFFIFYFLMIRPQKKKMEEEQKYLNTLKKGGSKLCRTEFYLWVTTTIGSKVKRPNSDVGKLIANRYDSLVVQFETDPLTRQQHLAAQTKEKALKSMRKIVTANLKPHIDGEKLKDQIRVMETMFYASWTSNVKVGSLNKNQVKRKFGKLIIGKTTGYAARWLYRLLKQYCELQ